MASAAAFPATMPCLLNGLSGTASSEASRSAASIASKLARFGNAIVTGTPETMLERTRYAAVAAAASFEAFAPTRRFRR